MPTQEVNASLSAVTICNQALSWLGVSPIVSLSDPRTEAELCNENYEFLRNAVLEERMWTFATVRAVSETGERDPWDVAWVHQRPLDWLQVFRVYPNPNSKIHDESFRMEGGKVLSRHSTIYMWGIEEVTDTNRFSFLFAQCLAARIAADLAISITENRQLQEDLWKLYAFKLSEAATRDGQQGANERIQTNILTGARQFGGKVGY
jgi:hypothetical protein